MATYGSRAQPTGSASSFGSTTTNSQSNRFTSSSATSTFSYGEQNGLFPPPLPQTFSPPPPNDGPQATSSVMNKRAGDDSSLYQICRKLKRRLSEVPGFHEHIVEMNEEEAEEGDFIDPVTAMWNCLRRGFPLMTVYNALRPLRPLNVDHSRFGESKIGKACTFQFLKACVSDLKFPSTEVFLITDLYGEDTTGFVKVTKCVNKVLDLLEQRGLLMQNSHADLDREEDVPQTKTHRQKIVEEIVKTERDYVQHLETLQAFKTEVEGSGAIAGDAAHDIFLNLNALIDFQRRFLIRIEQQNGLPEAQQDWGKLFYHYKDSFRVYEPFIANQSRCQEALNQQWDKLSKAQLTSDVRGLIDNQPTLLGFLLKPFQRLCRYPMLLEQLQKKGGLDESRRKNLEDGINASKIILNSANEAVAREQRLAAVNDLSQRVDDWKGHKLDHFGDLLLFGSYTVIKGEGSKEVEREYKVYLFEKILLCCKEFNLQKQKNKMLSQKSLVDKRGIPKLQLKGRIFMQNVTDVVTFSKAASYTIQIFWRGDPGVENFVIRFPDERKMKDWQEKIQEQKRVLSDQSRRSGQSGPSDTTFRWQQDQPQPENPYRDRDEEDEDKDSEATMVQGTGGFTSRTASNTSLRSLGSQQKSGRAQPPRFGPSDPGLQPPLTLNTNIAPGQASPSELAAQSYFSPTQDSPTSIRSSSQAGFHSFPRQPVPPAGWTYDGKHRTAPAMPRAPSREGGPPPSNRPSAPAGMGQQYQNAQAQSRLRSASTPTMDNPHQRRQPNGQLYPPSDPVPPIPNNVRMPVNRSQTASPHDGGMPIRTMTQTPTMSQQTYDNHGHRLPRQLEEPHMSDLPRSAPRQALPPNSPAVSDKDNLLPSQLKVKILFDPSPSHVTIVVPISIKYRTLVDRIDSKMARVSSCSIARSTAKLRYRDADDDLVAIMTDEDVVLAIEEWASIHEGRLRQGIMSDFELFWQEKA